MRIIRRMRDEKKNAPNKGARAGINSNAKAKANENAHALVR